MRTGTCDRCGAEFTDRSPTQNKRWCSRHCRTRSHDAADQELKSRKRGLTARCRCGRRRNPDHMACDYCTRVARGKHRDEVIRSMWAQGADRVKIAEHLGLTPESVTVRIAEMRRRGIEVPHRRPDLLGKPHLAQPGQQVGEAA